jgi:hypothetical protein
MEICMGETETPDPIRRLHTAEATYIQTDFGFVTQKLRMTTAGQSNGEL